MKANIPLDPTIDYREVITDPRFAGMPARVRSSVMAMLKRQEKQRNAAPGTREAGIRKNKQRQRNKTAKASRRKNR